MDVYVADPEWRDYIVWYFFLGGIAAGAFAMASIARVFGDESDRRATRAADYLALPLVSVCGILLILDLGRPERFWHMLIASETWRPILKWWSPMSAGSWGLSLFGGFAAVGFAGVLVEDGWIGSPAWKARVTTIRRGPLGYLLALGGAGSAFFLGSYTGVLLAVTNQPVWSDSTWIGALFLASSASTGIATMLLVNRLRLPDVSDRNLDRLERLDLWAVGLEAILLVVFLISLGRYAMPALLGWPGILVVAVVVPLALIAPLALRSVDESWAHWLSPILVLVGGFALRLSIVGMPGLFRIGG